MSASLVQPKREQTLVRNLRDLLESYAGTHAVDVWYWQRSYEGWALVAGTTAPLNTGPGLGAVPVGGRTEAYVEVSGLDLDQAERAAQFLAVAIARVEHDEEQIRNLAGQLSDSYEEINLLYTISETVGAVITLEGAARKILTEVADTTGVKRAALWVYEPSLDALRLVAAVGGDAQAAPIPVNDQSSVTAAVFRDGRSSLLDQDDEFPRELDDSGGGSREPFLSVPVSYTPPHGEPRIVGVINLIGLRGGTSFTTAHTKLLTAIASQVGAAVENSRLVAESVRQERMDREMELAHDLQLKLLPPLEQFRDRADVAARCSPADSVGGDFYHLFGLPGGCFGVVIGDVSSHGFGAALIMALTMSAIAIHASEGDPPAEVLRRAHRALIDELESTEMYVTLFYGVIDPNRRRLTFANAGHAHAFIVGRDGEVRRLQTTNPPFGIIDLDNYGEATADWAPREDLLFLFTDGLSDALGIADGEQRLLDEVVNGRALPLDQLLESLFALTPEEAPAPSDDRTAVLLRV